MNNGKVETKVSIASKKDVREKLNDLAYQASCLGAQLAARYKEMESLFDHHAADKGCKYWRDKFDKIQGYIDNAEQEANSMYDITNVEWFDNISKEDEDE